MEKQCTMNIWYNLRKSCAPAVFTQALFLLIMDFIANVFQYDKIRTMEENMVMDNMYSIADWRFFLGCEKGGTWQNSVHNVMWQFSNQDIYDTWFYFSTLNCKLKGILEDEGLSRKDCKNMRYLVFFLYRNQIVNTGVLL